jgi:hypothetical protein
LLIVYRELEVSLPHGRWRKRRFHHLAKEQAVVDAIESFRAFPSLVADLASGVARVEANVVEAGLPLTSLTQEEGGFFWPSPDDVRSELTTFAPAGSYESIFVFWPQNDSSTGTSIPCRGWGLGMGAGDWSNGATYAVVANAPSALWQGEAPGEVWLHEWLHGVCHHFQSRGHPMPERDADGAELHGYVRSPKRGWTQYYRDLMTGKVSENGGHLGIPLAAWREDLGRIV